MDILFFLISIFFFLPVVEFSLEVSSVIKWFQFLSITFAGNRTIILFTKFSVNHH
jgi:hypothetical protein